MASTRPNTIDIANKPLISKVEILGNDIVYATQWDLLTLQKVYQIKKPAYKGGLNRFVKNRPYKHLPNNKSLCCCVLFAQQLDKVNTLGPSLYAKGQRGQICLGQNALLEV